VNERRHETVRRILSGGTEHYHVGGLWKLKLQVRHYLGQAGHCLVGVDFVR
jgi:hypothetical protein